METSLIVAKILGIYLVVSGIFLLVKGKTLPHLLKDFYEHPAIMYLTGVILIFLSSLYILQNNVWDGTWRTVISIFAWLVLLKGIAYIFIPDTLQKMTTKKVLDMFNVYGFVAVIAGISLLYIG